MFKMKLKCFLAAFDFDYTIIMDNSDTVIRDLLHNNIPESLEHLQKTLGWTRYMDEIFRLLYENNVHESEIRKAVASIKPVPNTVEMLKCLKKMDCEIIIISDANTVFIDEWLKAYKVDDCIDRIYSNPAEFCNGRLHIRGYHHQDWCKLSPKNMCKGYILFEYIAERQKNGTLFRYVTYCGDGNNDLCPSIKLRSDDFIFPRKHFCLDNLLKKYSSIKANIIPWDDTSIIVETLQQLKLKTN